MNVGNLGRASGKRIRMREWVEGINQQLESKNANTRVVAPYGHTGNLIVDSAEQDTTAVGAHLSVASGTEFDALGASDVDRLIEKVDSLPSASAPNEIRWTPGLVFRVDGSSVGTADRHDCTLGSLVPTPDLAGGIEARH